MAGADVTVSITGDTTVPEAADKSKKAMGQMERAVDGLNKKMEGFGKDLLLSYIAPMVLLNRAFDYIGQKIEENKQKAKEALEFATKGESKYLEPSTVSLARRQTERTQDIEDRTKAIKAKEVVTEDFLRNASEKDMERFYKRLGPGSRLMLSMATYESASKDTSVQNAVRDIENANMLRDQKPENKGFDSLGVQNAVFGMGTTPLNDALTQQIDLQTQQLQALQRIEGRLPEPSTDYTKNSNQFNVTTQIRYH